MKIDRDAEMRVRAHKQIAHSFYFLVKFTVLMETISIWLVVR